VMAVNVTSSLLTAKYAAPLLRAGGGGAIINISSCSGLANQRKAMVYSVSKAALISLTKSEAIDLAGSKIRANAILPGSVRKLGNRIRALLAFCCSLFAVPLDATTRA
jgi:NAD(P)-dependent dehydrogenase (short-subunit alcohol dehydrogenase family)